MPAAVQAVVSSMQPLARPLSPKCKADLKPVFTLAFGMILLALFMGITVSDHLQSIDEVDHALCGGDSNFVVKTSPVGVVYAANTSSFQSRSETFAEEAVLQHAFREEHGGMQLLDLSPRRDFIRVIGMNIVDYADVISSACDDMLEFMPYSFAASMRSVLNLPYDVATESVACDEFVDFCDLPDAFLLRMLCAETCGCADPMSGSILAGDEYGGCPTTCSSQPDWLASSLTTCDDFAKDSLIGSPAWERLWNVMVLFLHDQFPPELLAPLAAWLDEVSAEGCEALAGYPLGPPESICTVASLQSFCPASCGCAENMRVACPLACGS